MLKISYLEIMPAAYSVVKMLVGHNMMESVDEDGNTPLHLACTHGYEEVALCLMKNHADVGARYNHHYIKIIVVRLSVHNRKSAEMI